MPIDYGITEASKNSTKHLSTEYSNNHLSNEFIIAPNGDHICLNFHHPDFQTEIFQLNSTVPSRIQYSALPVGATKKNIIPLLAQDAHLKNQKFKAVVGEVHGHFTAAYALNGILKVMKWNYVDAIALEGLDYTKHQSLINKYLESGVKEPLLQQAVSSLTGARGYERLLEVAREKKIQVIAIDSELTRSNVDSLHSVNQRLSMNYISAKIIKYYELNFGVKNFVVLCGLAHATTLRTSEGTFAGLDQLLECRSIIYSNSEDSSGRSTLKENYPWIIDSSFHIRPGVLITSSSDADPSSSESDSDSELDE